VTQLDTPFGTGCGKLPWSVYLHFTLERFMKSNRHKILIALLTVESALLVGCASNLGGDAYSRSEARHAMSVRFAIVESVRQVRLEGTKTPIGTTAGAVTGGVIGSSIGKRGISSTIGAVVGAVAGGIGGSAVEEAVTRGQGVEITVKMENGSYLAIVQADGGEQFQPGERVRLVGEGAATRVTR
jgi:outer membrane lipoprotein SlyB